VVERRLREKVIINVLHTGEQAEPALRLGPVAVGSMEELADRLGELAGENRHLQVILRADRRLHYGDVRKVMEIIAAHKLTSLQIVAELEQDR